MRVVMCAALLFTNLAMGEDTPPAVPAGDADRGRAIVVNRELGHCLLCHEIRQIDEPFQGNLGPDLSDVGGRLPPDLLRQRVVDPTRMNPDSVMPPYHRTDNLINVAKGYAGKPILNAREVEDVVAFLSTLKQ